MAFQRLDVTNAAPMLSNVVVCLDGLNPTKNLVCKNSFTKKKSLQNFINSLL